MSGSLVGEGSRLRVGACFGDKYCSDGGALNVGRKAGASDLIVLVVGASNLMVFCATTSESWEIDLLAVGTSSSAFCMQFPRPMPSMSLCICSFTLLCVGAVIEGLGEDVCVGVLLTEGPSPKSLKTKSSIANLMVDPTFIPWSFLK